VTVTHVVLSETMFPFTWPWWCWCWSTRRKPSQLLLQLCPSSDNDWLTRDIY